MSQVAGKRLTYSELTGKSDSPHMPETGTGTETDRSVLVLVEKWLFAKAWSFGLFLFAVCRLGSLKECSHGLLELLFRFWAFFVFGHIRLYYLAYCIPLNSQPELTVGHCFLGHNQNEDRDSGFPWRRLHD